MYPVVNIFGIQFSTFNMMIMAGAFVPLFIMSRQDFKHSLKFSDVKKGICFSVPFILIGGHSLFVFAAITGGYSWSESLSGGSVFYGGLIGFFVGLLIYAKYVKRPFLMYANFLTPYIALGHSFGRIGCLLGGCCYGAESGLFPFIPSVFSIKYPITHPTLAHPVLPIPLAESILCLLLSLFLFTRKSEKDNFMIYLTVYSVLRFALEFGRGDKIRGIYGLFSTSQWISIGVFFFVSAWFLLYKKPAVKI